MLDVVPLKAVDCGTSPVLTGAVPLFDTNKVVTTYGRWSVQGLIDKSKWPTCIRKLIRYSTYLLTNLFIFALSRIISKFLWFFHLTIFHSVCLLCPLLEGSVQSRYEASQFKLVLSTCFKTNINKFEIATQDDY